MIANPTPHRPAHAALLQQYYAFVRPKPLSYRVLVAVEIESIRNIRARRVPALMDYPIGKEWAAVEADHIRNMLAYRRLHRLKFMRG